MSVSEAQKKAQLKYEKKTFRKIRVIVRKDAEITADDIRAYAASRNESINGFLLRAVKETIDSDLRKDGY